MPLSPLSGGGVRTAAAMMNDKLDDSHCTQARRLLACPLPASATVALWLRGYPASEQMAAGARAGGGRHEIIVPARQRMRQGAIESCEGSLYGLLRL